MADNETLATETATDAAFEQELNQAQESKTYTQEEVDNMMARMRGSLQKKLLKPYEELGDPEELKRLKAEAEERAQQQAIKRGEFEKTLQELAQKKDAEIQKRDQIIREYKVNSPLLNAAATNGSVNPEQVRTLLSNRVRLNDAGETEVLGDDGSVRYSDSGEPLGVDDLVREFLDSNPHFRAAQPATTNSKSSVSTATNSGQFDLNSLDMKRPEHRRLYAEARSKGLV